MARSMLACGLLALLAATALQLAAAEAQAAQMLGKDIMMQMPMQLGKGSSMGGNTNVDTDYKCEQVCNEVCTPTPEKQCQQIPYQTQACNKVPVQKTKQVCNRTCTKTTTVTEAVAAPSTGKGAAIMMPTSGKYGRRLSGVNKVDGLLDGIIGAIAGKAIAGAAAKAVAASAAEAATVVSSGKGAPVMMRAAAPQVDEECNDVCNDVAYTDYTVECQMVQQLRTKCDTVWTKKCNTVCKPNCKKITTYTTTTTQQISGGKGVAMPVVMSSGKGGSMEWGKRH